MPLDITLRSLPETEGNSNYPPLEAVRFYESSWPGLVTLATSDQSGMRFTRDQVERLVGQLCDYLIETEPGK